MINHHKSMWGKGFKPVYRELLNFFIVFLSLIAQSCNESATYTSSQRISFANSVTRIFGGGFSQTQIQDTAIPSLDLHLYPSSLSVHIDTVINSCQALNLNFHLAKNSENFTLRVRIYEELMALTEPLQGSSNEYIRFENSKFKALSTLQQLPLEDYRYQAEESPNSEHLIQNRAWQAKFNQDNKQFEMLAKPSLPFVNDEEKPIEESISTCANKNMSKRLLVRQSLTFDGGKEFYLALMYAPLDNIELELLISILKQKVREVLQEDLDGLFLFNNPSSASKAKESTLLLKKNLDQSELFTWALPSEYDREFDDLQLWKKLFAYEDFAADFQAVRILFMDSTQLHMTQKQLDQLDQWQSEVALSPSDLSLIHTRALVSARSFSNPLSGSELSYQQDALRTLNRLRKAHMTHQFIGVDSFNDTISEEGQKYLGTQVFGVPKEDRVLLLKIPKNCMWDLRGEACFSPQYLKF